MKKSILIASWVLIGAGFIYLSNCSKPLEINEIGGISPDTIFVHDTVTDTLYNDTTIVDTVIIDTTLVDTVFVDSMFCARLSSHRQEIVWMLFNDPGSYVLDFQMITERIRNPQTLVIDIDGQQYSWTISNNSREMSIETDLERNALIRIMTVPPHAYGQAIDICLRVSVP
jgi:hypothetical protein